MMWALLDCLSHAIVKICDILNISLECLEVHEVLNLDVASNWKSNQLLMQGNVVVDVL
jgi:hypothetical protein